MIHLDGSLGEGGGQILRSSLALSLITQQAFTISNIRAKRPKPGLMRQHLACVQAAAAVCGLDVSAVTGAAMGSTTLTFVPRPVKGGDYAFNVGSAGSCMLVLQTVLWPLLLADVPSKLTLQGGTHNPMAPSATYLQQTLPQVLAQIAKPLGGSVVIDVQRHGFYPAGGGLVGVAITPFAVGVDANAVADQRSKLLPMRFAERGALQAAYAVCLHAGVPQSVAQRELETVGKLLGWKESQLQDRGLRQNEGPGNALQAVLQYEHITEVFTAFGGRGKSAEQVGRDVAAQVHECQACSAPVGEYLADQLMLPLALAGVGEYTAACISEHTRTNAAVIEAFLPVRFVFEELGDGAGVAVGVSLVAQNRAA